MSLGGEPSINLPYLIDRLPSIYNKFPKLREFQYSTNISTLALARNTSHFIEKVNDLNKENNRKVKIDLQFSIDGPPELNDYNRIGAKAETITENISYVLGRLPKEIPLHLHIKGTQSSDNLKWLVEGDNLLRYYKYFDNWNYKWEREFPGKPIPDSSTFLTFVYPGNFTQSDGEVFKRLVEKQNSKEFQESYDWKSKKITFDNQVTSRIKEALRVLRRGYYRDYKGEMLGNCTCCAGRSCRGLTRGGFYHVCHTTYMFNTNTLKYIEDNNLVTEFKEKEGFSFRSFNDVMKDNTVVLMNDELRFSRILYKLNQFHQDLTPRIQYLEIMLSSLACVGQISECYKKPQWRDLAIAYLIFGGNECPVNNIWEFGSPYIRSNSHLKLVFNGAFEYYVNNFYDEILGIKEV